MLFILTGDRQSGKTRWLMNLIDKLTAFGITCHGVVSPGVWRRSIAADGSICFEKLGIEAVLLPQGERLTLARYSFRERDDCDSDVHWQSKQAGLGWAISDAALEAVNRHFDRLMYEVTIATERATQAGKSGKFGHSVDRISVRNRGLLVTDEIGKLELVSNGGFSSALRQLEAGPTAFFGNALVIVRNCLQDQARERLEKAWGGSEMITLDEHGAKRIIKVVAGDGDF